MEHKSKSIPLEGKLQSMRKLTVSALSPTPRQLDLLLRFAPFCTELTIIVDQTLPNHPSSSSSHENWFKRFTRSDPVEVASKRPSRASWELVKGVFLDGDIGKHLKKVAEAKAEAAAVKQSLADGAKGGSNNLFLRSLHEWTNMLSQCHCLGMLTVRVNSDKGWTTTGKAEDMLSILRIAVEYAGLPKLKHIRFQPINAMGITQFRWSDTATSATLAEQASIVWRNVDELDIQLHNPFRTLNESQRSVVLHSLHDYLASFASSLKTLRFIWLGDSGPSPLALHNEKNLAGLCRPIVWQELEEVWLGNIQFLDPAVRAVSAYAPAVRCIMTLLDRCAYRPDVFDYREAWIEFLLANSQLNPTTYMQHRHDSGNTEAKGESYRATGRLNHQESPRMLDYWANLYQADDEHADEESSSHPAWI